jgi:hypothetical protein
MIAVENEIMQQEVLEYDMRRCDENMLLRLLLEVVHTLH